MSLLIREVTRLYGNKRIWITEYGYQTNPPDRIFGVTPARQAQYLTQAYGIAKRSPRIDMLLWFLLRDETRVLVREGWQSGLLYSRPAARSRRSRRFSDSAEVRAATRQSAGGPLRGRSTSRSRAPASPG